MGEEEVPCRMNFTEFEKMSTSLSRFENSKPFENEDWIVLEKVHGANFSFHVDNEGNVKAARRRAILKDDEAFFCYQESEFIKSTPEKMKKIYAEVVKRFSDKNITQVSIWGELFGGKYVVDGNDLNTKKMKPIQLEIQYCPGIEWIAYDISYRIEEDCDSQEYLDYNVCMDIFEEHGVFYLKPLFKGAMNVALNYDLKFDSTIPKIMGLPELPKGSNLAEGIVAKPMKNIVCQDKYEENVRVIVKLKSDHFQEIKDTIPPARKAGKMNNKAPTLLTKLMAYATEQRLTNAISKHGFPEDGDKELKTRVVNEFVDDIFVDIKEDAALNEEWENAPDSEKNKIKSKVTGKANGLIHKLKKQR